MRQLDIFDDSRDRQLVNDLAAALLRDDLPAARAGLATLASEYPVDRHLAPATTLLQTLDTIDDANSALPVALAARREHLDRMVAPAAQLLFGAADARTWLALRWCDLARRAAGVEYDAARPEIHPAALWALAEDWAESEQAARRIPSWRRVPVPLAWVARAALERRGLEAGLPLIAELGWMAAARAGALIAESRDRRLQQLASGFLASWEGEGDELDWAWFPAWAAVAQPTLAPALESTQAGTGTAAEIGLRTVLSLRRLEHQGRQQEQIAARRQLLALHPELHRHFMSTR